MFPAGAAVRGGYAKTGGPVATFRAITTLALVAIPLVMYFTAWYTAAFHSVAVRELTHLALLVPGFVFFWTLLRVDPVPKAYSYGVALWITFVEVIGDAFLGLAVIADNSLIGAGYYHALARPWGPSLQTDQILGGGTLWILGDLVGLPFLMAQLIQFIREDEAEAAVIDAELDARDAAGAAGEAVPQGQPAPQGSGRRRVPPQGPRGQRRAAGRAYQAHRTHRSPATPRHPGERRAARHGAARIAGSPGSPGPPGPAEPNRPWWESDPRFSDRFKEV